MTVLIHNAEAMASTVDGADSILIDEGTITAVGKGLTGDSDTTRIDAAGCVVTPGLINTHHHMFQTLTRVRGQDQGLFGWLHELWPLWLNHDPEWQAAAVSTAVAELLLSGCTTSVDHHYLAPRHGTPDTIHHQISAAQRLGIRLVSAVGSMDVDDVHGGLAPASLCESSGQYIERLTALVERYHDPSPASRTQIAVAPCHPLAATPGLMQDARAFARDRGLGFHTHVAEAPDEEATTLRLTGRRPLDLLAHWDVLGPGTWLAHCVHLSPADIDLLARTGTAVTLCPSSNLRLGSGVARVRELLDAGVTVSLGIDGSASNDGGNALAEARQLLLISRAHGIDQGLTAAEALSIATRNGAVALGRPDLGHLVPGARADLAIFDVTGLNAVGTEADPLAGLLLSPPAGARHVMVEGELVVRDHALVQGDAAVIAAAARKVAQAILEK